MRFRESGMPTEETWNNFFTLESVSSKLNIGSHINLLIDIGCGYGTFLFPMADKVQQVLGIDIDQDVINLCKKRVREQRVSNIDLIYGDILTENTLRELEKYRGEIDYITLFNILHCDEAVALLETTYDLLNTNGQIGVLHWNYTDTPRGPSMEIRPKPETIVERAEAVGFRFVKQVDLPPYHYGLLLEKRQ